MAYVTIADMHGTVEAVVFPDVYEAARDLLKDDNQSIPGVNGADDLQVLSGSETPINHYLSGPHSHPEIRKNC